MNRLQVLCHLKTKIWIFSIIALFSVGIALTPLKTNILQSIPSLSFAHDPNKSQINELCQGILIGVLGGLRSITADFVWISSQISWEQKNMPKTETLIQLITTIDPRPPFFWLYGARVLAYDIPHWRIWELEERLNNKKIPDQKRKELIKQQAQKAFKLLDKGRVFHPEKSRFLIEKAMIYHNKLGNIDAAAQLYKKAAKMEDAPPFAARIYGELLRQQGRKKEAYQWYRELLPTLSEQNPYHHKSLITERIHDLKKELYRQQSPQ
jgi:tetratricopeptide (TPR) repeat protein